MEPTRSKTAQYPARELPRCAGDPAFNEKTYINKCHDLGLELASTGSCVCSRNGHKICHFCSPEGVIYATLRAQGDVVQLAPTPDGNAIIADQVSTVMVSSGFTSTICFLVLVIFLGMVCLGSHSPKHNLAFSVKRRSSRSTERVNESRIHGERRENRFPEYSYDRPRQTSDTQGHQNRPELVSNVEDQGNAGADGCETSPMPCTFPTIKQGMVGSGVSQMAPIGKVKGNRNGSVSSNPMAQSDPADGGSTPSPDNMRKNLGAHIGIIQQRARAQVHNPETPSPVQKKPQRISGKKPANDSPVPRRSNSKQKSTKPSIPKTGRKATFKPSHITHDPATPVNIGGPCSPTSEFHTPENIPQPQSAERTPHDDRMTGFEKGPLIHSNGEDGDFFHVESFRDTGSPLKQPEPNITGEKREGERACAVEGSGYQKWPCKQEWPDIKRSDREEQTASQVNSFRCQQDGSTHVMRDTPNGPRAYTWDGAWLVPAVVPLPARPKIQPRRQSSGVEHIARPKKGRKPRERMSNNVLPTPDNSNGVVDASLTMEENNTIGIISKPSPTDPPTGDWVEVTNQQVPTISDGAALTELQTGMDPLPVVPHEAENEPTPEPDADSGACQDEAPVITGEVAATSSAPKKKRKHKKSPERLEAERRKLQELLELPQSFEDVCTLPEVQRREVAPSFSRVETKRAEMEKSGVGAVTVEELKNELAAYIKDRNLAEFYSAENMDHPVINILAEQAAHRIANDTGVAHTAEPQGSGRYYSDLSKTALYKTVLLIDDSKSMQLAADCRVALLKKALLRITSINAVLDTGGLSVRFLNYPRTEPQYGQQLPSPDFLDNIKTPEQMTEVLNQNLWSGGTELGRVLRESILEPMGLIGKANGTSSPTSSQRLDKPVLISIITDGEPEVVKNSIPVSLTDVIYECKQYLRLTPYGQNAVAFHITQIGNDPKASTFLDSLAQDERVADMIYCTSEHLDHQVRRYLNDQDAGVLRDYNVWWVNQLMIAISG